MKKKICIFILHCACGIFQSYAFELLPMLYSLSRQAPGTFVHAVPAVATVSVAGVVAGSGQFLMNALTAHAPLLAGGSAAAVALGGLVLWQVRKNGRRIQQVSEQVAQVQEDLSLAREEINQVGRQVEGVAQDLTRARSEINQVGEQVAGLQNDLVLAREEIRKVDTHVGYIEQQVAEGFNQTEVELLVTREAIIKRIEELEQSLLATLEQKSAETDQSFMQMHAQLADLRTLLETVTEQHESTRQAIHNLEQRTQAYFDDKFAELDAKQDTVIALLTAGRYSALQPSSSCSKTSGCYSTMQSLS